MSKENLPKPEDKVALSGTAQGSTDIVLGCATCPRQRTVTVNQLGGAELDARRLPPLSILFSLDIQAKDKDGDDLNIHASGRQPLLRINHSSCQDTTGCEYAADIQSIADHLAASTFVLSLAVEPTQETFGPGQ